MNIHDLDLNLLLVFHTIYHERSVSAAAEKLNLSQPALSAALRKLRDYTGDVLFFRSGNKMAPTRVANTLAVPIAQALGIVQHSLNAVRSFDPHTAVRTFRIAINDFFRVMLLPVWSAYIEREAPGITLEFQPQSRTADELLRGLREEEVDIGAIALARVDSSVSFSVIGSDDLVFVVRKGHPVLDRPITKESIESLRWVATSSAPAIRAFVEKAFLDAGFSRKIAFILPDTVTVPSVIGNSDLATIMGRSFFERAKNEHGLAILNLPIKLPPVQAALVWSKSADDDQGLIWLRRHIEHTMRTNLSAGAT